MNTTFITRYFISSIVLLSLTACGISTTNTADNRQQIIPTNPESKKDDSSIVTKFAEKKTNDIRLEHETAVAPERHKARTDTLTKSLDAKILHSAPLQEQMAGMADYSYSHPMPTLSPQLYWPTEPVDHENYAQIHTNPIIRVAESPVSTFSIDVDSGSYTNTRRKYPPKINLTFQENVTL